jgi:hypothetical protein
MLRKLLLTTGVLVGVVFALAAPSFSGPRSDTSGDSVLLTDDDGAAPMFQVPHMAVGVPTRRCLTVTNAGSRPAVAHVFARAKGRLRNAIQVEITRGSLAPATAFPACAGFVPDRTVDTGLGVGVVYRGTLAALARHHWTVALDPGRWQPGRSRSYRVRVTLMRIPPRHHLVTTATFVWKARGA